MLSTLGYRNVSRGFIFACGIYFLKETDVQGSGGRKLPGLCMRGKENEDL